MKVELLDYSMRASLSGLMAMNSLSEYKDLVLGLSLFGIENF